MSAVLAKLPDYWKITVELISNPGRDDDGNLRPNTSQMVNGCLLSPSSTTEQDGSDLVTVSAVLAMPTGIQVHSTDRVRTFPGSPVVAVWNVVGEPAYFPLGTEVQLRRDSNIV